MDMNNTDSTLREYVGELSGSSQQGTVTIRQNDRFDPLRTCLDSQFAVVEENEQGAHPLRYESSHEPEHMALDPTEQLTDRAYSDSTYHFEMATFLPLDTTWWIGIQD